MAEADSAVSRSRDIDGANRAFDSADDLLLLTAEVMLLGARKVHCDFTADGQLTMPFICEVDASIGAITSHIVKFDLGHRLDGSLKDTRGTT